MWFWEGVWHLAKGERDGPLFLGMLHNFIIAVTWQCDCCGHVGESHFYYFINILRESFIAELQRDSCTRCWLRRPPIETHFTGRVVGAERRFSRNRPGGGVKK